MKNRPYNLYYTYLHEIEAKSGLKVYHRRMKDSHGAYHQGKSIVIDNEIKGTIFGLIILLHEYHHHLDFVSKKHHQFYKDYLASVKWSFEKKKKYIFDLEWDCYKYAKNEFKKRGIVMNSPYFSKVFVKNEFLPLWLKEYNIRK